MFTVSDRSPETYGCSSDLLIYLSINLKADSEAEVDEVYDSGYFDFTVFG